MEAAPETRVVMLMGSTGEEVVVEAVIAGAPGCIQKETDREWLLSAERNGLQGDERHDRLRGHAPPDNL